MLRHGYRASVPLQRHSYLVDQAAMGSQQDWPCKIRSEDKTMKHGISTLLSALLVIVSLPTFGAVQLRVSDGTPGGTLVVTDQDPNDTNPLIGVVAYFGAVGANWLTSLSTGASKPTLGSAAAPHLDLNTFDVSSVAGGILTVELTDTDFTGTGPAMTSLGGVTDGSVIYSTYTDSGNAGFGKTALVASIGPTPSGAFSGDVPGTVTASIPYSITVEVVVSHPVPGKTGLDAEFEVTPPPGSNCVIQAVAGGKCTDKTTHHALYLPGIATDFIFATPGSFVENPDGTAHLSGTVFSESNPTRSFVIDVSLSGRTSTPPPGSPKKDFDDCAYIEDGGPIDTSTWHYYTNYVGTLTGVGSYAGALLNIVPTGPAFQVGVGANNKNLHFGASSWFIWMVAQQPSSGPGLPLTGQGDFNLDIIDCVTRPVTNCVQKADGGGQCSDATTHHALYLPGIGIDFVFSPVAGSLVENPDGTAQLTGTVVSSSNPGKSFQVNVSLNGRTSVPPPGSPKKDLESCAYSENGGPADTATWYYYTGFTGTLTGGGDLAGAVLTLAPTGPAFQVGAGANNKNLKFGASSWFIWTVAQQPSSGSPLPITGQGDFNLDIGDCPPIAAVPQGSICGSVLKDCDANGSVSGEQGLAGWTVRLKKGTNLLAVTTTSANGSYCFNNLAAGTYSLIIVPQPDYKQTVDPDSTKDNKTSVKLSTGQNKTGLKFGYTGLAPAVDIVVTGPGNANCGETITYSFAVTNTGNTCLYGGMTVESSLLGEVFHETPVAPGEGFTFTKTYVVKASDPNTLVNVVTVIGDPPGSLAVVTRQISVNTTIVVGCPPPVPTGLSDVAGDGQVKLTWQASSGASSYKVQRSLVKGGPYTTIVTGLAATTYTDTNVTNGVEYYYVVCASRNAIVSGPSTEVSSVPTGGLPSPFSTKDIGSVGDAGGAGFASGVFTVVGSGEYIWGSADEFRYVYQSANGDCTIVARVASVEQTDEWAKAGVMIRETLSSGARHASMFIYPTNGLSFQHRTSTGGSTVNVPVTGPLPPFWLKVERTGSSFKGYSSPDGVVWTLVGSQNISMGSSVFIGLAVTSHNDGTLCTATFENVTATP